jgi:glutamyl-tRNA reductase
MLNSLKLWNFPSGHHTQIVMGPSLFVLKTCQRTMLLTLDQFPSLADVTLDQRIEGTAAYQFLLETICGLKSRLIGENEIVGQFKTAYQEYAQQPERDARLMLVLEKLFQDAKSIRSQYLVGLGQKTYAALTRKHFISEYKAKRVVVIGSGQLAQDLINQLKKKAQVVICARNQEKVQELAKLHQLEIIPWDQRLSLTKEAFICNTIGIEDVLFDQDFFQAWSDLHAKKLFVDLGSPSCIQTLFSSSQNVLRLQDILSEGAIIESQKRVQLEEARLSLIDTTQRRARQLDEWAQRWQTAKETSAHLS